MAKIRSFCFLGALLASCVEQSTDAPSDEDVKAAREHILSTAPTPRFATNGVLSAPAGQGQGKLTYLGLDVDVDTVVVGRPFTLTHYYRVEQPVSEGWRLFVHLDTPPEKHGHLNADHVPIGGKYPLPMWKKGEIIRDIHKVSLPQGWAADKLLLYVGAWKGQLRFKVEGPADGANRLLAATLPVTGVVTHQAPVVGDGGRRLVARRLRKGQEIMVDGKLDEAVWKDARSTGPFVNTMTGAPVEQEGSAKVLWDEQNLYIAFEFADKDIWTSLTKHDDKLWTQEAAEVFLDADGDGKTYVELQVNPKNATFDSWLPAYRQNDNAWDAPMKTAVAVNGTLDKRDDTDKGWTVEMAIPLTAARGPLAEMRNVPPQLGTEWRVNFFRMDMPAGKTQGGSAWSAPLRPDFHALDRFGTLVFGDEEGNVLAKGEPAGGPHPAGGLMRKLLVNPVKEAPEGAAQLDGKTKKDVAALAAEKDGSGGKAPKTKGKADKK